MSWVSWLLNLLKSPQFRKWLIAQLGPQALPAFKRWIGTLRHRSGAIDEAGDIGGQFSAARIDGKRHLVVWKNDEPVSAYPPVKGDLAEKLRLHERADLRSPDDLLTRRARRRVGGAVARIRPGNWGDRSSEGAKRFAAAVDRLEPLLEELMNVPGHRVADHPSIPERPGIYLFSDNDKPIYVGQSRKLRTRLRNHTATGSKQTQASFAFNLAKREAGRYGLDVSGFRAALEKDPGFAAHFTRAKEAVAAMTVQYVEIDDPIERTLFEVYAALVLGTEEFNSFETH